MTPYAPDHRHVTFIGRKPTKPEDIIAVVFDGDELPLPPLTVTRLREVLDNGLTLRIHARDDAGLTRCTLAIALAVGLLPCAGEA